jgi:hypothetical protein
MFSFSKARAFLIKKSGILKKSGSAAIILSLVVSGSVLSTIFISQKSATWLLSAQDKNIEGWELAFVSQTAMAMGGYLIANNLILCKEDGWKNYDAKCKWNNESSKNLGEFNLISKTVMDVDGNKVLGFKGRVDEDVINNPQSDAGDIDYRITFDLVNWKETSIQNLIGEIPQSVCRDKTTMNIREGDCPLPVVDKCKNGSADIPNSVCEYIADNDQDYYIVLISVQVPFDETSVTTNTVYAGVRRPLSIPKFSILPPGPVCRLSCAGSVAAFLPECRGEFIPTGDNNYSRLKVKVTNEGPGAIYALSLLRKDTYKSDDSIRYKGIKDLLKRQDKEVFLPGEHLIFDDAIDCEDSISYTFSFERIRVGRNPAWLGGAVTLGTSVYKDVNVHAQPFLQIHYGLFSLAEPVNYSCMAEDTEEKIMRLVEGATCPSTYSPGATCGTGNCYYSHIEPRRNYVSDGGSYDIDKEHRDIKSGSVVRFLSPH